MDELTQEEESQKIERKIRLYLEKLGVDIYSPDIIYCPTDEKPGEREPRDTQKKRNSSYDD